MNRLINLHACISRWKDEHKFNNKYDAENQGCTQKGRAIFSSYNAYEILLGFKTTGQEVRAHFIVHKFQEAELKQSNNRLN